jgi:tRNA threonylcarbamoyl adenosine modification protein (Sua5/YciO/YrdC/YwlC family)
VKTEVSTDRNAAVELLRKGEIVALPTETVYGLAADALNPIAVAKIFEAKDRPRFDPLIVHLPEREWLEKIVDLPAPARQLISELAEKFWPGPFTMVLPKREIVPEIVTAGLDTVSVRISAHPVITANALAFGKPLAAPSANPFGRVSPTTAQHVLDDLGGRIPLIVDAGLTEHGIESTIVAIHDGKIDILRRGPVTEEDLSGIGFQPMNPHDEISIHRGAYLPHWSQTGATYAVTFRLVDALPNKVVADWELERRNIVLTAQQQKRDLTDSEQARLAKLFSEKIEHYLDAGHGKCWLRDDRVATVVRNALTHFQSERYELHAWCIMPNHVHAVVRPKEGHTLSEILHSWKSFTAKEANRLLNRPDPFWQRESYDRLIRNESELRKEIRYVMENPEKAGLKSWPWRGPGFDAGSHRQDADATIISAPGQLPTHYAPKTPLRIIDDSKVFSPKPNQRCGLLAWNPVQSQKDFTAIRSLSERQDIREAAANLFRYLRELDSFDVDLIVAERVPSQGLGAAIMDRLLRASHDSDTRDKPG